MLPFEKTINAICNDHLCDILERVASEEDAAEGVPYLNYVRTRAREAISFYKSCLDIAQINKPFRNERFRISGNIDALMYGRAINDTFSYDFPTEERVLYPVFFTSSRLSKRSRKHSLQSSERINIIKVKGYFACDSLDLKFAFVVGKAAGGGMDIAIIDFENCDHHVHRIASDVAEWAFFVEENFDDLCIDPPSHHKLYPNMCRDHPNIAVQRMKKKLAEQNDEITQLYNVGTEQRRLALHQGITKWSDPRMSAHVLGIKGTTKLATNVNAILLANRSEDPIVERDSVPLLCNITDMFVDFETSSLYKNMPDYLFMIGYCISRKENFTGIVVSTPTLAEEARIFTEFIDAIKQHNIKRIVHYSAHEKTICTKLKHRHGFGIPESVVFVDMLKHILDVSFVPKGALNFKLKTIVKCMYHWGMVDTVWTTHCKDGQDAMFDAFVAYRVNDTKTLSDILEYNRVDVISMMEVWRYMKSLNDGRGDPSFFIEINK